MMAGEFPVPFVVPWTIILSVPFNDFSGDIVKRRKISF